MPDLDPANVLPGDTTTGPDLCRRAGLTRMTVYHWRTRGYFSTDGVRVFVKPIPDVDDGHGHPVLGVDLEEAEHATRHRARARGNVVLAADQRRHLALPSANAPMVRTGTAA